MLVLILEIVILIVCILIVYQAFEYLEEIAIANIILISIILIVECVVIIVKPIYYKSFKVKYDVIEQMTTSSEDVRDATFTQNIIDINIEIEENRRYINSQWVGVFFNKSIAELELLSKGE